MPAKASTTAAFTSGRPIMTASARPTWCVARNCVTRKSSQSSDPARKTTSCNGLSPADAPRSLAETSVGKTNASTLTAAQARVIVVRRMRKNEALARLSAPVPASRTWLLPKPSHAMDAILPVAATVCVQTPTLEGSQRRVAIITNTIVLSLSIAYAPATRAVVNRKGRSTLLDGYASRLLRADTTSA